MTPPLVIWDPAMLGYTLGGHHPMRPVRWELTMRLAGLLGVLDGIEPVSPEPATDDELAAVHTPDYIAAVHRAADGVPSDRYGLGTSDNPIFRPIHTASALIAGGSIHAAREIAAGRATRAVSIAGGLHHAMSGYASGFCIYNDAALAIRALLDAGLHRIAYVDVDVHHGDGVQACFADDPRVLTISLHESPLTLWPGTGRADDIGRNSAAGTVVNVPLPAGTADADWLRAFAAVVPGLVQAFRPDALVTQHGVDSHAWDPLADLSLTVDGQVESYRRLRALADEAAGGRWLALGGGGYCPVTVVPRAWTHLLALAADRDIDPATALPPEWLTAARRAQPDGRLPATMSDQPTPRPIEVPPWDPDGHRPVDRVIGQVRRLVYPLHGLDPFDPRD